MDEWLRALVAKSSSIPERLNPEFVRVDDEAHSEKVDARMRAWLASLGKADAATFRRRLAWNGLDEIRARQVLRPFRLRPAAALPPWALTLAELLRSTDSTPERDRCLDERQPIPFEHVLVPFVVWARSACERKAGSAYACFTSAAHAALERQLLECLSARASQALLLELSLDVSHYASVLDSLLESAPSCAGYEAFVARMRSGELISFFEEYSVLARVLATIVECWVEAAVELLERFRNDRHAIQRMLGTSGALDVTAVAPSLSDPHHGMRSVAILTFASGECIVYKPRSLGVELAWNALLARLAELGAPVSLRTFRVLDRGDYGWAEFVEYAACKDDAEAGRYFTRAGALLAVIHLLHGTDCHADNLISAGEHPVLIDVETILGPQTRSLEIGAEAPRLARNRLTRSVLGTYLLPFWSRSVHDEVFDGSGFGADVEEQPPASLRWMFANTDRMKLARVTVRETPRARAAMADGTLLRVYEYEAELVSGFEAMYRFLMHSCDSLLAPGSPFQRLADVQVRFVYRNTSIYFAVLKRLDNPDVLRDGADRSIEIEQLAVAALIGNELDGRAGWIDIWNAERQAIERGDIPHFSVLARDIDLPIAPHQSVAAWFERSGHAAALERLNGFDAADLAFQIDFIRSALRSRTPAREGERRSHYPPIASSIMSCRLSSADTWCAEAVAIAQSLARDAIRGSDGSVSWLQPALPRELMVAGQKREIDIVGHDLYEGAVGIGLFLAATERVAEGAGLRALALGAVRPLMVELEERGDVLANHSGIGGLAGLGSVVYGLVRMHDLLDEPCLLQGAERAASLITDQRIDADVALDVSLGSAGALLGLLALYETNGSASALASATRCAQRLVDRLEAAGPGVRSLRTLGARFLSGFSHGAAGIAYALCRLHAVTRDRCLLEAARELVAFERGSFSFEHGDWPDLRHSGAPRFMAAWCHGAPGIALGRIGILESMSDEEIRPEIERALAITAQRGLDGPDHLCCGTFGSVEILSTAASVLGRPDLRERAIALAHEAMSRSHERGEYDVAVRSAGRLRSWSLFQGLTGIGYTLLRLARPDLVPKLLLLR